MSWTNERIELLQKLRLEGWSASRIAGELAHGITRNAVIGKVYRLELSGGAKALPGNVPASPPHKAPRRPPTGMQTVRKSPAITPWLYTRS